MISTTGDGEREQDRMAVMISDMAGSGDLILRRNGVAEIRQGGKNFRYRAPAQQL